MKKCLIKICQNAGCQQSTAGTIDVSTEVSSSGNSTSDNARLEHQASGTISDSCIDVSTEVPSPLVDSSAGNFTEKRHRINSETSY